MDIIERFNKKFGDWYEGLFGEAGQGDLRPKDVLRQIITAMEDNRSEGFDGKIYVPNKYILELNVPDADERDYLLSFLDEEELTTVLQRFMAARGYASRGPLDFTVKDREPVDGEPTPTQQKLSVRVRYEKGPIEPPTPPVPPIAPAMVPDEDLPTVASLPQDDDLATVAAIPSAWAALAVTEPDGRRSLVTVTKTFFTIGRTRHGDNDLVLAGDGQVSKHHARIEREVDGKATVYDLGSTNGVLVNNRRIAGSATVKDGDTILIGQSTILFQQESPEPERSPVAPKPTRKARLVSSLSGNTFVLASETLIGKAVTCDIVLDDTNVATRQAEIAAHDGDALYLEDLAGKGTTLINDRILHKGERTRLTNGDRVQFGGTAYQYLEAEAS